MSRTKIRSTFGLSLIAAIAVLALIFVQRHKQEQWSGSPYVGPSYADTASFSSWSGYDTDEIEQWEDADGVLWKFEDDVLMRSINGTLWTAAGQNPWKDGDGILYRLRTVKNKYGADEWRTDTSTNSGATWMETSEPWIGKNGERCFLHQIYNEWPISCERLNGSSASSAS